VTKPERTENGGAGGEEELVDAYELTMPLGGATQAYGYGTTVLHESSVTPDGLQYMTSLDIYPAALTNVRTRREPGGDTSSSASSEANIEAGPSGGSILSCNCVLVDISCYASVLSAAGLSSAEALAATGQYCWRDGQFSAILQRLRLSREQLEWLCFARRAAIVFHTGWTRFAPSSALPSDEYAPWHPYYLHPYLDEGAVRYLAADTDGPGVCGIACDLYDLESPLMHVKANHRDGHSPEVTKAIEALLPTQCIPLAQVAIENGAWVGRHFRVPISLLRHPRAELREVTGGMTLRYRKGRLLIACLQSGGSPESVLAGAYFAPDRWYQDE